ncbi:reverse transcriptase domain-containing protein [Tanacetum coccineum]
MLRFNIDLENVKCHTRSPQQKLSPITSLWPFYKWGIDIVGPFPKGPGKVKFLIVAIDYFIIWIEAKLVATITGNQIKKFHPQTNGLVERANRTLGEGIKARTEAVIPTEISMPTLRTTEVDLVQNNESLEINLDLLEERREQASIQEAKKQSKDGKDTWKLGPKWEGPYKVMKALRKGAYKLRDRDRKQLPRTWNISNLKKCYIHQM